MAAVYTIKVSAKSFAWYYLFAIVVNRGSHVVVEPAVPGEAFEVTLLNCGSSCNPTAVAVHTQLLSLAVYQKGSTASDALYELVHRFTLATSCTHCIGQ
jgi:hypothetical protein